MCGIAGIHGLEGIADPESMARRMTDAMAHRGPDATGVLRRGNSVLGHRRLSIIDLSAESNQPFVSADGRFALAFNGEIYNYRELRKQLEWPWRTDSDTEVRYDNGWPASVPQCQPIARRFEEAFRRHPFRCRR